MTHLDTVLTPTPPKRRKNEINSPYWKFGLDRLSLKQDIWPISISGLFQLCLFLFSGRESSVASECPKQRGDRESDSETGPQPTEVSVL